MDYLTITKSRKEHNSLTKYKRAEAVVNILFRTDISTNYLRHCQSRNNAQEQNRSIRVVIDMLDIRQMIADILSNYKWLLGFL